MIITASLEERFWAKVDKRGPDECWTWVAALSSTGYGRLGYKSSLGVYSHRLSYEIHKGPIPTGMVIDHICHTPSCVNPSHLQAVSHKQNCENIGPPSNNTSGVRGVHWNKNAKKWQALVRHNGRATHVGYFANLAEAEAAVIAKRNELHTNNLRDRLAS